MASDNRLNKKTPAWSRREEMAGTRIDSGPFIGIVKNNVDPIRAGRLQVWIPDLGGDEAESKNWRIVSYASPYYGTTYQPKSSKNNKFSEVTHTYGMWAVPPDIGNQVICTFIAGDPNRGYWFACVNPDLSKHMLPAMGGSQNLDLEHASPALKSAYDRSNSVWPVTEFNQNDNKYIKEGWINNKKPPHEYQTNILIEQGLDRDGTRGAVGSFAQRESPSTVFGISTPGRPVNDPKDDPNYDQKVKSGTLTQAEKTINTRKGGHSFVMDDGNQQGQYQLMRLRTAGGHQLLMNDSDHIVYLANSDGTVWLEFTGGGHINVYSRGGINMRTEGDFNFRADKNINIESGGNIKIRATDSIVSETREYRIKSSDATRIQTGNLSVNSGGQIILVGSTIRLNSDTLAPLPDLQTYKQYDTSWNGSVWESKPEVYESILTTAPSHEPWIRGPAPAVITANVAVTNQFEVEPYAPKIEKPAAVCEPQAPATPITKTVPINGGTNEQLVEAELKSYGITNTTQLAAIMAQCAHESGNFKYVKELGADSYFAKYEGRTDLGNTQAGDGLKYKGRGFIQITGRDLYTRAGTALGIDLVNKPELAEDPATAARLVTYFFFTYKASRTATVDWSNVTAVTRIVNGGTNGLTDRQNKFETYKTKYANGVVTTGSGSVLVDGSGKPVTAGSSTLDPGPESARGKSVINAAPLSSMSRKDTPNPGDISSTTSKIPGLVSTQFKALMIQIGYAESGLDYNKVNTDRAMIGRYQINGNLLKSYGYVTSTDIFTASSWTGKNGISKHNDWLTNTAVQDSVMEQILRDYYTTLVANKGIKLGDDVCTVAGMMCAAYFFRESSTSLTTGSPPNQAKFWREQATQKNKLGEPGSQAYNQGRFAVDVLSLQATSAGGASTAPADTAQTGESSGIDPNSVLLFTTGSGDYAHYLELGTAIRTAMEQMAKEYKERTGRKITINSAYRSLDEQTAIYNAWLAAGGGPNKPKAGGYYMPSKPNPNSPHPQKIAFDIPKQDIAALKDLGLLEKYKFTFPFPEKDPVHIQFKA